jgi:hypothetical protein
VNYFEFHFVSNIQGGILPVALNILACSAVGVSEGKAIFVSMKVKESFVHQSNFKLFKDDSIP